MRFFPHLPIGERARFPRVLQRWESVIIMTGQLLSPKDVAERLQVSLRTAQKIMRSVPHINIGSGTKNEHLRISEELLDEYIRNRTVVPSLPVQTRFRAPARPAVLPASDSRVPRKPLK